MSDGSTMKRVRRRGQGRGRAWARSVIEGLLVSLAFATVPAAVRAQEGGEPASEPSEPASGADVGTAELELLGDESAASVGGQAGAGNVWDEGVSVEQRRAARAVFLEANQLARDRFFATAALQYKQAVALWAHPAFYFNLALAQLQLDQPIEAYESLERALQHGPEPLGTAKYEQGRRQFATLESQLGRIEVACDEPGARVMLDGKPVFTGPGHYRGVVRPGAHQLVATRSGLPPVVEQAVLSPGGQGRFALAFQYPEVVVLERRWAAWKSWSVVGVGAALVLSGAYLDWDSTGKLDDYDEAFRVDCAQGCDEGAIPAALVDRRHQAESEQRIAVGVYAAGGVVLAAGVALVYLGRGQEVRRRVQPASLDRSAVVPVISADSVGVRAAFRF